MVIGYNSLFILQIVLLTMVGLRAGHWMILSTQCFSLCLTGHAFLTEHLAGREKIQFHDTT